MAISKESRRSGPYVGTGTVKTYPFDFLMRNAEYVAVYQSVEGTTADRKLEAQEFSVTLNSNQENNPGGTVVLNSALASGVNLSIVSEVPYTQNLVLTNKGGFYPESINDAEDERVIQIQQLYEALQRCVSVPITSLTTREELLQQLMEVAAKANEYAQLAEKTYQEVLATQGEVVEAKSAAEASASNAADSALSAQKNAEKIATDKAAAEELLKQTTELAATAKGRLDEAIEASETAVEAKEEAIAAANSAGFSCRFYVDCSANNTYPLAVLNPSINARAGDHVVNGVGELYEILAVSETSFTVGNLLTSIKGEKGDKGDSLKIADTFGSVGELEATYPNGIEGGVLVGGDIYYWSPTTHEWVNQGRIRGPAGEQGKDGVSANEILMSPDPVAYFNEIYGMTNAVAEELVVNVSGTTPSLVAQFEEGLKG